MEVGNCNKYILPIKNNDERAFKELFDLMYRPLARHIFKLTNAVELSEELTNDIFISLWKNRSTVEISVSLKAYLYRAATNKAYDYYRSKEKKPGLSNLEDHTFHLADNTQVDDQLNFTERQRKVYECVDKLPKRSRLIFSLSRFSEYPRQKIADEMDITLKTVENQITRALKFMKKCVYEHDIGGEE